MIRMFFLFDENIKEGAKGTLQGAMFPHQRELADLRYSLSYTADDHSAGLGIPRLLWNSKINYNYTVHKSPPLDSNLSHLNPAHIPPRFNPKINFNSILLSTPTIHKSIIVQFCD
jgi:hypothetical protein